MRLFRHADASILMALIGGVMLGCAALPAAAQEVTVLCNYEVDWCEAMKAAYEKTTGQKAAFIHGGEIF